MAVDFLSNFTSLLQQVQGMQALREGMSRLSKWATEIRSTTTDSLQSVAQVAVDHRRLTDLIGGKVSAAIDYERRSLRIRIVFLERSGRILTSFNVPGTAASDESFEEAADRLRLAREMIQRIGFDETAVKIQVALDRAEKALAHGHAELLFSDPELSGILLSHALGPHGEDLHRKEEVIAKIEREGLEGYLEFLIAALNQHWTPVHSFESMWERFGHSFDEEMMGHHRNGVRSILGLLKAVGRDPLIQTRFQSRWETFSRLHTLEIVRNTAAQALKRDEEHT